MLLTGLARPASAESVGFSAQPVPGGFDIFVHADFQIEAIVLGLRTDGGCAAGCTFRFDDARASFAAGRAVTLEDLGSFFREPTPGLHDFIVVQGVGDGGFALNSPVEASSFQQGWRLGTLFTADSLLAPFVAASELEPAAGRDIVFARDSSDTQLEAPVDFGLPGNQYQSMPVPEPPLAWALLGIATSLGGLRRSARGHDSSAR